jgi:hypothetical protein
LEQLEMGCTVVCKLTGPIIAVIAVAISAGLPWPAVVASEEMLNGSANDAKNLARVNCGTHLALVSGSDAPDVRPLEGRPDPAADLLLDDNTLSCHLSQGNNTFLVALQNISALDRFTFINENPETAGTAQIFVSNYRIEPNDSHWIEANRKLNFSDQRFISMRLAGVEAKYVKISFNVKKPGMIAGLGLYGQKTLASFANQQSQLRPEATKVADRIKESPGPDNLKFNFANLYARAQVVHVSSGEKDRVQRMIDDDPTTAFAFLPNDAHPTVVIELAEHQRLRRVSAVYERQPGRLDIYVSNQFPDVATLTETKPLISVTDQMGSGKAAADFNPRGARYVTLRWTPANPAETRHAFKIAEIGAFGDGAMGLFDLERIPEQFAQNSTVLSIPSEPPPVVPISP